MSDDVPDQNYSETEPEIVNGEHNETGTVSEIPVEGGQHAARGLDAQSETVPEKVNSEIQVERVLEEQHAARGLDAQEVVNPEGWSGASPAA